MSKNDSQNENTKMFSCLIFASSIKRPPGVTMWSEQREQAVQRPIRENESAPRVCEFPSINTDKKRTSRDVATF